MKTSAHKTSESKTQSVANNGAEFQDGGQSTLQFVDNRPEAVAQRRLNAVINNSPQVAAQRLRQTKIANPVVPTKPLQLTDDEETLQAKFEAGPVQQEVAIESQPPPNNIGPSDHLKSGIENLSGYSMDKQEGHNEIPETVQSNTSIIQRKVVLTKTIGDVDPQKVVDHIEKRAIYLISLISVFSEVQDIMPEEVQEECARQYPHGITFPIFFQWLREWDALGTKYDYTDDENGYRKLAKDVIKYHFHAAHGWISVGSAAYMTGDATGLSIAATIDPKMSLKILKGQKSSREKDAPTIYRKDELPSMFDIPKSKGKIRESDVEKELEQRKKEITAERLYSSVTEPDKTPKEIDAFHKDVDKEIGTGTADIYKQRFNEYTSKALKPWNKETYEATRSVGLHYPRKQKEIQSLLLPQKSETLEEEQAKIHHFKKAMNLGDAKCILLWQRLSGQRGGAHKELDSHPIVLIQMARAISERFSDYTIILVGDKTISAEELGAVGVKNRIISLQDYWNSKLAKENHVFPSREHQNYFLKLLGDENGAISVGMRSGSLESSALLGIKTIYLDDMGNRAAGRMEFWAGDAADGRSKIVGSGKSGMDAYEKAHEGPIPNYKRLATGNQLGSEADKRFDYFSGLFASIQPTQIKAKVHKEGIKGKDDGDVDNAVAAILEFRKAKAALPVDKIFEEEPILFKTLSKTLNTFMQKLKSPKSEFGKAAIDQLTQAIGGQMAKSFLSANELEQLLHLIQYLDEQKPNEASAEESDDSRLSSLSATPSKHMGPTKPKERIHDSREEERPLLPLGIAATNQNLMHWLTSLNPEWGVAFQGGPINQQQGQMLVNQGEGVMLGEARNRRDLAPVSGQVAIPPLLNYRTNNGRGALCFIYSVVMGLTGASQEEVEPYVARIARAANATGGWIAADSGTAQRVIAQVQHIFGVNIQVVEIQNSVDGPIISGRSHNVAPDVLRPIVIRNTGGHYDAVV